MAFPGGPLRIHELFPLSLHATIMVPMNVLADAIKNINNAKKRDKHQVLVRQCSRVVIWFITVIMNHDYIGKLKIIDDHRAGKTVVNLIDRLDKCGVSFRFHLPLKDLEKWQNNLPRAC